MYGNTPVWKDLDLNSIGYFTQMYVKDSSGGSGTGTGIGGNISPGETPGYALLSKSYAVGDTGIREGEDTDNAKYYYEFIKYLIGSTNLMDGVKIIYGGDAFEDFSGK